HFFFSRSRRHTSSYGDWSSDVCSSDLAVEFGDDVDEIAKRHARGYAFTFGAMGSAKQNFYKNAFERQGWTEIAREVQQLWLDGKIGRASCRERVELFVGSGNLKKKVNI